MSLNSARFAGVDRLERCLNGEFEARLTPGTQGDFVALVQQALMDLGESLPNFGADGTYGAETVAAVLAYKTRHGLRTPDGVIDGVVGPLAMAKLDEECAARDETPGPCPPDSDGPVVDLADADEQLVNMVLARTTAAAIIGVNGDGGTRLVTLGVEVAEPLTAGLVNASARILGDGGPAAAVNSWLRSASWRSRSRTAGGPRLPRRSMTEPSGRQQLTPAPRWPHFSPLRCRTR